MTPDDPQPLLPFKKKLKAKRGAKKARAPRKPRAPRPPEALYIPPPPPDLPAMLASIDADTGWNIDPDRSRPIRAIDTFHRTVHLARPASPVLRWDEREALQKHFMADAPAEATLRRWMDAVRDAPPMTLLATCNTPSIYPDGLPALLPATTAWEPISTPERRMRGWNEYRRELVFERALTVEETGRFKVWLFDDSGTCPGYCHHKLLGSGARLVATTVCDTSD